MTLFDAIRDAAARVAGQARSVRVDEDAARALGAALARERPAPPALDPAHEPFADEATTLAFVITLDAVNFGSGWFPVLDKRPGLSGYRTLATALRERFQARGAFSADELSLLEGEDCARLFGQERNPAVGGLMSIFARSLRDLGDFLGVRYGGRFAGPVEAAGGSAERLVEMLTVMPLYRDVARYAGFEVPFLKRAQITCSDLALAFGGRGPGAFRDLASLTCFADNLVPHVLRLAGVLRYDRALRARIHRGDLIAWESPEEVEIRAGAVHAVELVAAACAEGGYPVAPHALDHLLWARGQSRESKLVPRHRTRCPYY